MKRTVEKLKEMSARELVDELRWIWKYVKEYKFYLMLYIALGFISTAFGLAGSVISKKLINAVTGTDSSSLLTLGCLYVGFGIASVFLNAVLSRISAVSSTNVTKNIRQDVFSRVMSAKWQDFVSFRSGDILNRVNNDVSTVSASVLNWIPTFITKFFQFVCAFFLILHYDKAMALLALLGTPATVIVSAVFVSKMRENTKKVRSASSELVAFLSETFRGIHNIKAFDLKSDFDVRFRLVQSTLTEALLSQNKISVISSVCVSVFGLLVSYSCFGFAVYRLWKGAIDFGTMAMFMQLSSILSGAFSSIVSLIPNAVSSAVSASRLMEITQLEAESTDSGETERFIKNNRDCGVSVVIQDVCFSYEDDEPVLHDVNLHAEPGEIVALVGRSGAGKTTILRLLLSLVEPESGKAVLSGTKDGERLDISERTRRAFAYVPQGHSLFSGSIAENMRMLRPNATDEEIVNSLKAACAYDFVSKMPKGIHTVIGEDNFGLSEGQAQRISIARAILSDSPVILLDESTSAIDLTTEKQLLENIKSLSKKKTCILITHKTSVMEICSRVYSVADFTVTEKEI
ncbi:MAG: ABC transporter ATP-binding protein [Acutalibacteraceae bacterium]